MKENMKPDPGSTRGYAEASDARFSAVLRTARPSPSLPPRFQENVWRRIAEAEVPAKSGSWLDAFAALVLRPRFAYATVATVVLAGVLLGTYQGAQTVRQGEQARYLAAVAPNSLR